MEISNYKLLLQQKNDYVRSESSLNVPFYKVSAKITKCTIEFIRCTFFRADMPVKQAPLARAH